MANLRVDKITSTETFETTGSVQFDGNGDYLRSTTNLSDYQFGTGDFTVEAWIYKSVNGSNNYDGLCTYGTNGSGDDGWFFEVSATRGYVFWMRSVEQISFNETPNTSQWIHTAVTRKSGVVRLFVNGVLKQERNSSTEVKTTGTSFDIGVYAKGTGNYYFNGHISNLRVVKGKAFYTADFKPPMREFEVTPETSLLACQSKTDAILEKTGKTFTVNGNAVASELTPGILTPVPKGGAGSAITGSVEFDGSGATSGGYLEVTPDDDLQFLHKCTDSYTVEAYKQASTQGTIFDSGGSSSTTIGIILFGDSGGVLKFRARQALSGGGFHSISTGDVMANDMWHHVALTYDKSTVRLFVNGILVGSTSYSTESSVDSTQSFKIGAYEYSGTTKDGHFNGHISNLRVVKGTALYTHNFIPPTRDLKKIPGTVLLCCQDPNNPLTEATGKTITGYKRLT